MSSAHVADWTDHGVRSTRSTHGPLIRLRVDRLPGGGDPLPLWLWSSAAGMTGTDVDLRRQSFLRRFDLEHTFRMIKQTLGWTRPKLRTPEAADRWTWLIVVAHTQLRQAHPGPGPPGVHGQATREHHRTEPIQTLTRPR